VIVYLHGFNSSPQSHKAKLLGEYLAQRGLASCYGCPALPPLASEAVRVVEASLTSSEVCFVGSSLGGFYATYFAEARDARAVLINPAIEPYVGLRGYLGRQRNLYTGQAYELTEGHLHDWQRLEVPRITPSRYLLLLETGDEVLDYRQAVRRYAGCEQVVVQGGDHSLQSFPRHLARIVEFAGHAALV
jgi:predicted esterase YcpF (UPF0227 family)